MGIWKAGWRVLADGGPGREKPGVCRCWKPRGCFREIGLTFEVFRFKSTNFIDILEIGILKSQKPLPVEYLAKKMISEALLKRSDSITTFKSKDLFESMSFIWMFSRNDLTPFWF